MRHPVLRLSMVSIVAALAVGMFTLPTVSASDQVAAHITEHVTRQPGFAPPSAQQLREGLDHAVGTPDGAPVKHYDPFYDDPVPTDQLDRPGKILRTQAAPHLLNILGPDFPGYAERILYTSTTVDGRIVPVSGFVINPARPWPGPGPTPTVVVGPGTRGAGDACAPSRGPWMQGQIDTGAAAFNANYELASYQAAAMLGMKVVVTDYIGLGTPGAHTYVLHDEEGHAMLDAARAVVAPGEPVGFWGYSQGGGAAAAAAELAGSYAPELNVKGSYAGAPPADLIVTMSAVDNSSIHAVLGYALNGWTERFPEFTPVLEENLNERGREFMAATKNGCIADGVLRWGFRDSREMTASGRSIVEVITSSPAIRRELEAQKLGRRAPNAPIMVSTMGNDNVVPTPQAVQLARDYCAAGVNVTLLDDGLPNLTPSLKLGANHAIGVVAQVGPSMMWLVDRFNDVPTTANCHAF